MDIPETIPGIREALMKHADENLERFSANEASMKALWKSVNALERHEIEEEKEKQIGDDKMASLSETINVGPGSDSNAAMLMAAMASKGGDGLFGAGGGGLIGGLILGSLLRNNGNLFGNDGVGAVAGATLRNPPEQNQANMDLMQAIGAVDKSVAVSTATMEASQATQTLGITNQLSQVAQATVAQITGVKEAVNAGTMVLAQQLNGVQQQVMQNRYELSKDINTDGDKTRALITQQYEATLNRQLTDANAAIIALQAKIDTGVATRGVEVNTTNNINQMQQQQQQQAQYHQLAGLIYGLAQQIRSTNEAINVGSGTLTANPTNTNTNIR